MAEAADPHVIVMDYKMPGMDGIKATRRIREILPLVPVILYTAYLDDLLTREAESAGVSVCIAKPDGIHTLERQISALSLELADVDIR
jgi:CheY-like chemotaxis protein